MKQALLCLLIVAALAADRDNFIGRFTPIGFCSPSSNCCCPTSVVTVRPATAPNQINVNGKVDGGPGCMNMNELQGVFTVTSPTTATLTIFDLQFTAQLSPDYQQLTILSTVSTCPNLLQRINGTGTDPSLPPRPKPGLDPYPVHEIFNVSVTPVTGQEHIYDVRFFLTPLAQASDTLLWTLIHYRYLGPGGSGGLQWIDSYMNRVNPRNMSYPSLKVLPGQQVELFFTYRVSSLLPRDTPFFSFLAPGIAYLHLPQHLQDYLGVWRVDEGKCKPSRQCCCAVGNLTLTPYVPALHGELPGGTDSLEEEADPSRFVLIGSLDGGLACTNLDSLAGVLTLQSDKNIAELPAEDLHPGLTAKRQQRALTLVNSLTPGCPSVATKVEEYSGQDPGLGTGGPIAGGDEAAVARMSGQYTFDSTCSPGPRCCCGAGVLRISPYREGSDAVLSDDEYTNSSIFIEVFADFDGGRGCLGFSAFKGAFILADHKTATFTKQGIRFTAKWSPDYNVVRVTNTYQTSCPSQAVRLGSSSASPPRLAPAAAADGARGLAAALLTTLAALVPVALLRRTLPLVLS